MTGFDVLVIGAGSAGSVVAARLSEDPGLSVGLVEAGAVPSDPDIASPQQWPFLPGRAFDWAYRTIPQPGTAGRSHDWPRGRIVGGSSCLHAMAHVRGHPDDFEPWAAAGGPGWSYQALLPAFRRSERFSGGASAMHGDAGPLDVLLPGDEIHPLVRDYMDAGVSIGAPRLGDHNAGPLTGAAPNQLTIRDGRRVSVADAYLVPALGRPNLTLLTDVLVHDLVMQAGRACGARITRGGVQEILTADRIVLCAGTVASPLLLMRSGIGDPDTLRGAGIACRHELPEVGRNLHDHLLAAGNVYRARRPVAPSRLQHSESLMYLHCDDPSRAEGSPDVVLACVVLPVVTEAFARPEAGSAYTIMCGVTHPTSRGSLRPGGPSVADVPIIDPAYLSTGQDRRSFRASLRLARAVGRAAPLRDWNDGEILPGPGVEADVDLDAFLARAAMTHHHPVGTCSLGPVVDGDLRVRGIDGLFVVDASVIPSITAGPVNAAVVAIAETWAGATDQPGQ
ncbi:MULTISPECIES: GMC family oxidoreductase [unclassified Inquilinus]|uniref:GMC family oxidoreductase n=1 Tax=unclassified Inquilinus TaxID=2645927 RepID=UPI003F8DBF50